MFAIYKRELRSFMASPLGYIFISVYFVFSGVFFTMSNLTTKSSDMSAYFSSMMTVFMFLMPILTMKLYSEDRKSKTDQILLTAPVGLWDIVFGKFLSCLTVFIASLSITFVNAGIIMATGKLEFAVLFGNLIGIILVGSAFIAIGGFISNLTESQVVAAISSFAVMLSMLLAGNFIKQVNSPIIQSILSFFSLYERYADFTIGLFNFASIIYYISITFIFIFLTVRFLEKRRWS